MKMTKKPFHSVLGVTQVLFYCWEVREQKKVGNRWYTVYVDAPKLFSVNIYEFCSNTGTHTRASNESGREAIWYRSSGDLVRKTYNERPNFKVRVHQT